jgi:hypothetical protein
MGGEQIDYFAILADLEAKRMALEAAIASVRAAMIAGLLGSNAEGTALAAMSMPSAFSSSLISNEVPAGAFLGKSIPDAAKLYLEIVKKKQTSKKIADALQKGGMETNSKNFQQMVHSVLDRARKATNSGIVKLDRSHWGLATWYPASLRSAGFHQGRGAGRKKSREGKTAANALAKTSAVPGQKPRTSDVPEIKGKAHERAVEYLRSKPNSEHSLAAVGQHLGMGIKGARLILGKLVKAGKVRMSTPGMYTVTPFQLPAVS